MSMQQIIPLMDALKIHDKHYKSLGDYSVTGLIDTPRRVALFKRYQDKIIPTPEASAATFVGVGVHSYWDHCLRQYAHVDPRYEIERTITEKINDRLVTGRFDILYDHKIIYDIKTCKVWKLIFDPSKKEWTEQLNLYAYLLGLRGIEIEKAYIIAQYMDWIESQSMRDKDYPRDAVEQHPIVLWDKKEQQMFLEENLARHKACENLDDNELPVCSPEDRWERHPGGAQCKYAILKARTEKRALRVYDTQDEAVAAFKENRKLTSNAVIEVRYAEPKRCTKWCSVNQWCNWYIDWSGRAAEGNLNDYLSYSEIHG